MANTEGNTYDAKWQSDGTGFVAWLEKRPRQKVRGATEEELVDQLWEIAMDAYGDGEACINLEPPLPVAKAAAGYFDPPWFAFSCNEGFHQKESSAALYRKGLCSFCRAGLGGRNETERIVEGGLKGDLGFVWSALPGATIVSGGFLRFLRRLLGDKLRAVSCRSQRRPKAQMWELELTGDLPLVCHKNGSHNGGVVCPKCDTARFGGFVYEPIQKGYQSALARADVAKLKAGIGVAFAGESREIVVGKKVAEMIKAKGFKGVLLKRVALLPKAEIGEFKVRKLKKSEVG